MSVESMSLVLNHSRAVGTDKVVMLGIANHDGDGGAWPSIATLARYANVNARTVQRSVESLVKSGELSVRNNEGGNGKSDPRYRPNLYVIQLSPGVTPTPPLSRSRGDSQRVSGVTPTSPEPSLEPSTIESVSQLDAVPVDNVMDDDEFLNQATNDAVLLLVEQQCPRNPQAYIRAIERNRREHVEALRMFRRIHPDLSTFQLAACYVGNPVFMKPGVPAWIADQTCKQCHGEGFVDLGNGLFPCLCRTSPLTDRNGKFIVDV